MNCKDPAPVPDEEKQEVRERLGCGDRFLISYIGSLGRGRLVPELARWGAGLGERYFTVIGGTGVEAVQVEDEVRGRDNVRYLGLVPLDEAFAMFRAWVESDVTAVVFWAFALWEAYHLPTARHLVLPKSTESKD